ncbi:hypothetical protein GJ496_002659 [Pomphorhynchus laevis]|nr:hypothetical protein GJ496_002659 [Pomphorhynchus laevis]
MKLKESLLYYFTTLVLMGDFTNIINDEFELLMLTNDKDDQTSPKYDSKTISCDLHKPRLKCLQIPWQPVNLGQQLIMQNQKIDLASTPPPSYESTYALPDTAVTTEKFPFENTEQLDTATVPPIGATRVYSPDSVVITSPNNFVPTPNAQDITCWKCHAQCTTKLRYISGPLTYLICMLCLLQGCWCGCCLMPFEFDQCKDVEHICPSCNSCLGIYKRLF